MITPDDLFDLFSDDSSDLPQDEIQEDRFVRFDRGRMLGSLIIRKVSDLIDTYKAFDSLKDKDAQAKAKDRALRIYNKILVSYLQRATSNDTIRGLAYEDAFALSQIIDTLTKHFERLEDYSTCIYLTNLKEDILYQDLTKSLWVSDYEPIP